MTAEEKQKLEQLKKDLESGKEKYLTDTEWYQQVRKGEAIKMYANRQSQKTSKQIRQDADEYRNPQQIRDDWDKEEQETRRNR